MPRRLKTPRFRRPRARSRRRSRLVDWWLLWRVPLLALIVMAAWWFVVRPVQEAREGWTVVTGRFALCSGSGARQAGCVVDGDTVVIGFGPAQRRIRLTGFDAPELDGACEAERTAARAARDRLHRWLAAGPFEWSGGDDPPRDRYGRELREARRTLSQGRSQDLAETMIADGLAAGSGWGAEARDWCA